MSQIQAIQCDECGAMTDDLHNKDWSHFTEQGDNYCADCKLLTAVTVHYKVTKENTEWKNGKQ